MNTFLYNDVNQKQNMDETLNYMLSKSKSVVSQITDRKLNDVLKKKLNRLFTQNVDKT